MRQYHELLQTVIDSGNDRGDRTGTGTRSCFGLQFRHSLAMGFPLLTTKKLPWKSIVTELLWFLRGDTNIRYLLENNVHIWTADAYRMYKRRARHSQASLEEFEDFVLNVDGFADKFGDLGPIYGKQWCRWEALDSSEYPRTLSYPIDQIKKVIESIRTNPEGRRHIVTAWNPAEVDDMALPPCHCMFQFYVSNGLLSCHMYQRSADSFLGVPFNIASYALLTHIVAHQCNLDVGELVISFGDVHIYNNHMDQVKEQLIRAPRQLPTLQIMVSPQPVENYTLQDFVLDGYDPHPAIHGDLSVGV